MCCSSAFSASLPAAASRPASLPGSYNDGSACEAGTYSPSAGATSCLKCAEGSIAGAGASACTKCPPGTFYVSATECKSCAVGQYTKVEGAKECLKCAAGYGGSRTLGATSCAPCPKGSMSLSGSACAQCPAGSYANMEGSATCTKCPPRTASAIVGATSKSQCILCKNQPRIGFTPAGSSRCH